MSIFTKIGAWLAKAFKSIKNDGAKVAVTITEDLQNVLKSGVADALVKILEGAFPSVQHVPEEILAELRKWMPKVLAAELALQGIPDNPSEQDLKDFAQRVMDAFSVHDQKSKLYTTFAAQVYGIIQRLVQAGDFSYAKLVAAVEEAYQDYLADLQSAQAEG